MPALFLIHVCPSQFPNFWLKEKNKTERDSRRPRSRHSEVHPGMGGAPFHGPLGQGLDRRPRKTESPGWKRPFQGTPERGVGAPTGSSLGQCNPIQETENRQGCAESIQTLRCCGCIRVDSIHADRKTSKYEHESLGRQFSQISRALFSRGIPICGKYFIQQFLLSFHWHCSRHQGYIHEQVKQKSLLSWAFPSLWVARV